jgi:AraC-like DNA-binding protein
MAEMNEIPKPSGPVWQGQLDLGDRWAFWRGDIGDGVLHRHFAAQAIVSDSPVRVFDEHGRYVEAEYVLIDPLTLHKVMPGRKAKLIYIEPGKRMGPDAVELLRPVRSAKSLAIVSSTEGLRFWSIWLSTPAPLLESIDARLSATLEFIEGALAYGPVPLQIAASQAQLSPDRFRHLFADQMGLTFRRYVLWRRLRLASTYLMDGQDVTTAAHAAGFSDAAHFARTIKSTFGVTATQALVGR